MVDAKKARAQTADKESRKQRKVTVDDSMSKKYPWLKRYLETRKKRQSGRASSSQVPVERQSPPPALSADQYERAFEDLESQRRRWQAVHHRPDAEFRTTMLGGAWTMQHVGVAADAIKAFAAGQTAQTFCTTYHLAKMQTFSIKKFSERDASCLALFWCAKMQHLFDLWIEVAEPPFSWTEELISSFDEEAIKDELFGERALSDAVSTRLQKILDMRPV